MEDTPRKRMELIAAMHTREAFATTNAEEFCIHNSTIRTVLYFAIAIIENPLETSIFVGKFFVEIGYSVPHDDTL